MRKVLLAVFGTLLVALLAMPGVSIAADTFKDVFIVNDADHPVPTKAQGTTQVDGTVQVGNTPTVNVATGSADHDPYQKTVTFNQGPNTCTQFVCEVNFPAVPAGKRLVITYASAQYGLSSGGTGARVRLSTSGSEISLPAPVRIGFDTYVASAPVTFYVNAGQAPTLSLGGQFTSGSLTATASVVGYLVSAS